MGVLSNPLDEFHYLQYPSTQQTNKQQQKSCDFYNENPEYVDKEELKVDNGSEGNLIPIKTYRAMYPDRIGEDGKAQQGYLEECHATLRAYGGSVIGHLGK